MENSIVGDDTENDGWEDPEGEPETDGEDVEREVEMEVEAMNIHSCSQTDPSEHSNHRGDGSDLARGQQFDCKEDLNYKLNLVAILGKFETKVYRSTRSMKEVRCIDDKCSWRVRAVKLPKSNFFVIRNYVGIHTCTLASRSMQHKQATSRVIGRRLHGHFKCAKETPKPNAVVEYVRNELDVRCSYWKAWKAKNVAQNLVRGTAEHSYAILPSYCYMLKKANEGTVTHIKVDEDNRFKYFFMALGVQIRGFKVMRKVIGIDGAWMKSRYRGVLFVASTQDSEFHSYPLAWGVADSENNASWTWFLEKLKELIPDDSELCIISDRSKSIEHAVGVVYPERPTELVIST